MTRGDRSMSTGLDPAWRKKWLPGVLTAAGTPGRPHGWGSPGDRSGCPREPHCNAADPVRDGGPVCQPLKETWAWV